MKLIELLRYIDINYPYIIIKSIFSLNSNFPYFSLFNDFNFSEDYSILSKLPVSFR